MAELHEVFLGLGSNLGDRGDHLQGALVDLEKWGLKIMRASSVYESEPIGYIDQPWFYNMAVRAETDFSPEELLKIIHMIELSFGRRREIPFGPRPIDVDILFYGHQIIDFSDLKIPHPRLQERKFVLMPMAEIAGDFIHPLLKKNMIELLKQTPDKSLVRLLQ